jgi:hypothetical protein
VPIDPRRRQKKLERRKAKQKNQRRELARREAQGMPARLEQASAAPILHCCTTAEIGKRGMGQVLVSRQLGHGKVAYVVFLLDTYCLGVKDVMMDIVPRAVYERNLYAKLTRQGPLMPLKPECARKLVEGAVAYALDLGLAPHADYRAAKGVFGDIRAEECDQAYVFGKDGKPLFVAGPYDDPERCRYIRRTLEARCGPDGYHFILPAEGLDEELGEIDLLSDEPDELEWDPEE